jgi:HEAT repeat protein
MLMYPYSSVIFLLLLTTVHSLNSYDSLITAQTAACQGDWSLLQLYLQTKSIPSDQPQSASWPLVNLTTEQQDLLQEQALAIALDHLATGDFHDRWEVAKIFPGFGDRAIAPLLALLTDETTDPELQWFLIRILEEFRNPTVLTALMQFLQIIQDDDLMQVTASSLAKFGVEAIAPLATLLADESTQAAAVQILAQIRHSETIPLLLQVVNTAQPTVRTLAIEALSSFHDPRVPNVLIAALSDPVPIIRQSAVTGLSCRPDLLNEFDLVKLIQPLLFDDYRQVAQQAAIALARLKTETAATALFQRLQSAPISDSLQIDLVQALGWIETPTAHTYLQNLLTPTLYPNSSIQKGAPLPHLPISPPLQKSHPSLSIAAIQEIIAALGRTQVAPLKRGAVQCLIDLLNTTHPALQEVSVRQTLALALGQLGDRTALDPLIHLLADPDPSVKLHAIAALKTLDAEAARQRLLDLTHIPTLNPALQMGVEMALQEWLI